MRRPPWFDTMGSRVFMILLVGIVAAATLAFTAADLERHVADRRAREQRFVDRVADLTAVLDRAPVSFRPALLGPGPDAPRWAAASGRFGLADPKLTARLTARLGAAAHATAFEPSDADCGPHPPLPPPSLSKPQDPVTIPVAPPPGPQAGPGRDGLQPPSPACSLVTLRLVDGGVVAFTMPLGPKPPHAVRSPMTPVFLTILALAAGGLAFTVARVSTAPLRRLSKAAVDLGRDLHGPPLTVEGPWEVRRAAEAFNLMQVRLKHDLAERTHMLAAITHDLQTPMTRLRLRLEKVPDAALRAQLLADQAAMLEMIRDGLDLARASGAVEALQELDVDSLLHSLCEDASDAGANVSITARCDCSTKTRPQALKRCVSNLLDNALKYAGSAELSAARQGGKIEIRVRDSGPGIAADQIEAMMEPFVRLESSRSRETGGVGLGLTIARLLAERAGGTLQLRNRPNGGIDALVVIRCS